MVRHLPNIITLCRLFAVPLTIYLILEDQLETAFWVFVGAGISDAVDGAIARLCDARTAIGGVLDPLADKALLVSVYISLGTIGFLPLWLVILVVFRDLLIVGGVMLAYTLRLPVAMDPLYISKVNTLAQLMLAGVVLAVSGTMIADPLIVNMPLTVVLQDIVAVTTVLSGAWYVWRSGMIFDGAGRGT
ncbi:MAG: CDP-alcohol phosphatidyltransferase family protein [Rhodospirillaceae bacterium]